MFWDIRDKKRFGRNQVVCNGKNRTFSFHGDKISSHIFWIRFYDMYSLTESVFFCKGEGLWMRGVLFLAKMPVPLESTFALWTHIGLLAVTRYNAFNDKMSGVHYSKGFCIVNGDTVLPAAQSSSPWISPFSPFSCRKVRVKDRFYSLESLESFGNALHRYLGLQDEAVLFISAAFVNNANCPIHGICVGIVREGCKGWVEGLKSIPLVKFSFATREEFSYF